MGRISAAARLFGIDVAKGARAVRGLSPYVRNGLALRQQAAKSAGEFPFGKAYPCLPDRYETAGVASGHYFHQDLYVAQLIFNNAPQKHVDVGSRVDGLVAHIAAFRSVEVFDIRQNRSSAANIVFRQRDIMEERSDLDNYCDSLSCLHALEHFGLGRYGDPVDYQGYERGWKNLGRMLEPKGKFYFAVPIGPQRIEFDAHRVFAIPFLMKMIGPHYEVDSFSYVDDAGELVRDADPMGASASNSFGCSYGCGIFELTKR